MAEEVPADPEEQIAPEAWVPPRGSWEEVVEAVDTIEQHPEGLQAYLAWTSGKRSRHGIAVVKQKCPLKLLEFYERHLYVPVILLTTFR